MIGDLQPYAWYEDSGEPWLGRVPEHWELRRTKTLLRERVVKGRPAEPLLAATQTKGVVPKDQYENRTVLALKDLHLLKLVKQGDFVISLRSFQGGIEYARTQGIISPAYTILYPLDPRTQGFLARLFKSQPYIENLTLHVTGIRQGQNIDYEKLKRSRIPLPPPEEQAAIVRFLEYVDRRIGRYIRAKQKLIKLLEEQKQVIIHRAVTRGLDPNVPLKPSGVDWLGDIPAHWEVVQTRRIFGFVTSGSRGWAKYYSDDGFIFVQSGNLGRDLALNFSTVHHVNPPVGSEGMRTRIRRNDILLCITGALTGNVVVVDSEPSVPSFVNQHVALCRSGQNSVAPRFLAYVLHSNVGQAQLKTSEYGGTKQGLGLDEIKNVVVPLPPPEEQNRISSYLDEMLEEISRTKQAISREIALLREYRTRLIADVVTGKVDVREAAARLPDETEAPEPAEDADGLLGADDEAAMADADESDADELAEELEV